MCSYDCYKKKKRNIQEKCAFINSCSTVLEKKS